jgi:DNA-directed RNA polymerase beta subunit/intein/homing endonuclease
MPSNLISNQQDEINKVLHLYFKQPRILYQHLFDSFHQFVEEIIPRSLKEDANIFYESIDGALIHYHCFKIENIRIKPPTFDNDNEIKFPYDCRKNHLNYFSSIIVDIKQVVETLNVLNNMRTIKEVYSEKDIAIANIPIMIKSKYCSTQIKKDNHYECKFDPGGYFLVNGQEKIVLSIEKMVDNKVLIFTKKDSSYEKGVMHMAQINSRKNDWSENLQILTIKNKKDGLITVSTSQIIDIPLFIIMRALGLESDYDILINITYNTQDIKMINLLRISMINCFDDEGNTIKTREEALLYLSNKIAKNRRISSTDEELAKNQRRIFIEKILRNDLLQHLGTDIPKKRCFIGYMVNKLLSVILGRTQEDDRDALHNKRIETPGILLGQLFKQNWKKMLSEIQNIFKKKNTSDSNPINVIVQIKSSIIEHGIKSALATGVWGINRNKNGVAQSLQRLSWIQAQSNLRRVNSPYSQDSATSNIISIRLVNNNQYNFLCCVTGDTDILLANNSSKLIKDFDGSEIVVSINPTTLKNNETTIYNLFSKMPEKLFLLETIEGYTIKATNDHPFLMFHENNHIWKKLEDLRIMDFVFIVNDNIKYCTAVRSIVEIEPELVYDFTTTNDDHSFVANNFVVHNCVETPEGAKIGIVKNLSMMSSITSQNNSQEKIIKNIFELDNRIQHPADINLLEMHEYIRIFLNGDYYGVIKMNDSLDFYNSLKMKRRTNMIDKYTSMYYDFEKKEIKIYFDGGRLYRPLLIVENNKLNITPEVIDFLNNEMIKTDINKSWKSFLSKYNNIIEYEDIESCNYLMVANNCQILEDNLTNRDTSVEYNSSTKINRYGNYKWLNYTHCEFHGWTMFGTTAANVAFINHDYATKGIIHFSQAKQSIGIYLSSHKDRMDISQLLYHPQIPLTVTKAMEYNNFKDLPYGENAIVALMSYTGFNQEDSLILNKAALDRGLFRCETVRKNPAEIVKNPSTSLDDIFTKPDPNKVTGMKQGNYNKLNEKGFIPEETPITNNDIIIGKVSPIQPTGNNNKVYKDSSVQFKSKIDGVIDRVHTGIRNSDGYEMYNIRTRMERKPIIGDKFCLTPEHQVLTKNGFKFIDKVNETDEVACLNTNKEIYYTNPTNIYKYKHIGQMCQIKTDKIELITTLQHKMYVKINNDFELIEAQDLINKKCYYKKNGIGFKSMFKPIIKVTDDKALADYISIQMFHAGFACDIIQKDDLYHLIYDYDEETLVENIKLVNYYGYVYCIEVPHHIFYTRLNGKCCWTGNSNRHSQKATVGIILQEEDMPFTEDGMIPDMIMNPHCLPTRMTAGQLVETIASKIGALTGQYIDGTPFDNFDVRSLPEMLKKLGYEEHGNETMYCGMTGKKMDAQIFIGPCYQIRLKHMVQDKVHGRARGPRQALTRQPLEGRSRDGGFKIGEPFCLKVRMQIRC